MLAEAFADAEGWLHWCDKSDPDAPLRRARPSQLFVEGELYATRTDDGVINNNVESQFLGGLEAATQPILREIIASAREGRVASLGRDERRIWLNFFLTQWRRSPETQKSVMPDVAGMSMLSEILDQARLLAPHLDSDIQKFSDPKEMQRILHNARVESLPRDVDHLLDVLERRGILICKVAKPRKGLIISSRPVVKFTAGERTDIRDPIVEMWLPVAPDVVVGLGKGNPISMARLTDDRQIRQLNRGLARQSRFIAGNSPPLVRSVACPR